MNRAPWGWWHRYSLLIDVALVAAVLAYGLPILPQVPGADGRVGLLTVISLALGGAYLARHRWPWPAFAGMVALALLHRLPTARRCPAGDLPALSPVDRLMTLTRATPTAARRSSGITPAVTLQPGLSLLVHAYARRLATTATAAAGRHRVILCSLPRPRHIGVVPTPVDNPGVLFTVSPPVTGAESVHRSYPHCE